MAQANLHTAYPSVDARLPHFAPIFGAQPLVAEPERVLEQALTDAPTPIATSVRADPWPEVGVGITMAAVSGAVTGGVAAGGWNGAGIGAGVNVAAWSLFTLLNGWRALGARSRTVLGSSLVVGAAAVGVGFWMRRRTR